MKRRATTARLDLADDDAFDLGVHDEGARRDAGAEPDHEHRFGLRVRERRKVAEQTLQAHVEVVGRCFDLASHVVVAVVRRLAHGDRRSHPFRDVREFVAVVQTSRCSVRWLELAAQSREREGRPRWQPARGGRREVESRSFRFLLASSFASAVGHGAAFVSGAGSARVGSQCSPRLGRARSVARGATEGRIHQCGRARGERRRRSAARSACPRTESGRGS